LLNYLIKGSEEQKTNLNEELDEMIQEEIKVFDEIQQQKNEVEDIL